MPKRPDVLIVCALDTELMALRQVNEGRVEDWTERHGDDPYWETTFDGSHGSLRVVAAHPTRMGGNATTGLAERLSERLSPVALAMSGVCAGHPEDVDRGDVIIADRVFQHDFGKRKPGSFQADLHIYSLNKAWHYAAQRLKGPAEGFHGYSEPEEEDAIWWFLDRLLPIKIGERVFVHNPRRSVGLRRYVPPSSHPTFIANLEDVRKYVKFNSVTDKFELTKSGEKAFKVWRSRFGVEVKTCPYHIHIGPIGSGNGVEAAGDIWDQVTVSGMRKVLGIEMEAAAIGQVASDRNIPFIVVKGVMDHADPKKSDRFKSFAGRASAEVLCHMLRHVLKPNQLERRELSDLVQRALARADNLWNDGRFLSASEAATRAFQLARDSTQVELAALAIRKAIRAKLRYLSYKSGTNLKLRTKIKEEVTKLLTDYATVAESPAHVTLEQSMLFLAMRDGEAAVTAARSAYKSLPDKDKYRVDALVSWFQALQILGQESDALELRIEVDRWSSIKDKERILAVELEWLRTVIRASASTDIHLQHFIDVFEDTALQGAVPTAHLLHMLSVLASDLERASELPSCAKVCLKAYALSAGEGIARSHQSALLAIQAAEILESVKDFPACQDILRSAHKHVATLQHIGHDSREWATLRARLLLIHGRLLSKMALRGLAQENDISQSASLVEDAWNALNDALVHTDEYTTLLRVELPLLSAELSSWRGRIAVVQGRPREGAILLRKARNSDALNDGYYAYRIGYPAWMAEAVAHYESGDIGMSLEVASGLLEHKERLTPQLLRWANALIDEIQTRIQPVVEWMNSADAVSLSRESASGSVRQVVAAQTKYILGWNDAWRDNNPPLAEWLDFWGRGGFARVAAAARGRPVGVACVDAVSLDEIRHLARVLCPYFETVIVKWKGVLRPGLVSVPVDIEARNEPGGHGYAMTSKLIGDPAQWFIAYAWGNLLPHEVAEFIFTEARQLFRDGRLLVLPACLVGCTQAGVGWTDDLFATEFLHGAVNVVRRSATETDKSTVGMKRVLDLTSTTLPFVDGVGLGDMAAILRDTEDALGPLRDALFRVREGQQALRWENWREIRALDREIENARQFTEAKLQEYVDQHKIRLSEVALSVVAGSSDQDSLRGATEPMTSMLKAVSPRRSSPWVPLLMLEKVGGWLRWTSPLDNRSKPPTPEIVAQLAETRNPSLAHSWLYPGYRGWGARLWLRG